MGSCQSSSTPKKKKKKKTKKAAPEGGYSWEHRAQIDRSQYMVSKRKAETVVKTETLRFGSTGDDAVRQRR